MALSGSRNRDLKSLPRVVLKVNLLRFGPAVRRLRPELRKRMVLARMWKRFAEIPAVQHESVVHVLPVLLGYKRLKFL